MTVQALTPTNGSGRNGTPPDVSYPDFTTHLPNLLGKHYSRLAMVPYTPDLIAVAQDPLSAKKGLLWIDAMLRDDMVEAGFSAIASVVLGGGNKVVPAGDTFEDKWVADGFTKQLAELPGGVTSHLFDLVLAGLYGFTVCEKTVGLVRRGAWSGWIGLTNLLYRLPHFFEFPSEPDGELECFLQRDTWTGETSELPREKALYYVWNAWQDPFRGRSMLRPAYEHWYAKQQFLRFRNEQGERNIGKTKVKQTDGSWPHPDISFKDYAKKVLENYNFSRGFAELFGSEVSVMTNEMSPAVFSEVIDHCNKAILRAIGVPWLAVEEGLRTGTYALGKVHQEGFHANKPARLKEDIEEAIREQVFRWICRLNGIADRHCPSFSMSPVLEEDKQQSVALYIQALGAGALKARPQDENWVRERIGLEPVPERDIQSEAEAAKQQAMLPPALPPSQAAFSESFESGLGGQFQKGGGRVAGRGGTEKAARPSPVGYRTEGIREKERERRSSVRSEKRAAVKRDLDSLAAMDDDEEAVIRIYATPEEAAEYKTATDEFDQTEATYQKLTSLGEPEIVARYGGPNEQKAYTKAVNTDDLDRAVDIAAKAEKRHERDIDRVLDKQEKAGKKLDKVHERLATKTAERHQAKKDELEVKLEDIDVDELEDQDDHSEDFSELSKKNDWALRPLTRAEQRINFAALDDSLDGLIREYQGKLSKEWEMAVEGLRREVAGWVTSEKVSPDAILRKAQRLSMDLDGYVNEMERGALEAYGLGKRTADGELDAAGRSRTFEAKVSPENPHDLGHFRGLIRSRSFVVAEGQAQKVYSSIANSLMNSFENGDSVVQAIAKLDTQFSALASGQLISPGTSGHDYSKPAIQETTVRTLFADSMAGGRNDLFEEETASGFVLGTMRSEVAEGRSERSHPLSEWVDGIKVRMEDPRRLKLTGALHYNERGVDVPITQIDAMEPGFEWSSDAEIEQAIRKKQQLSPNFV